MRGRTGVTFVTAGVSFVTGSGAGPRRRQDAVPEGGEARLGRAPPEAVSALSAHARGSRRPRDAAGALELGEEADLPVDGPAVMARGGWGRCVHAAG